MIKKHKLVTFSLTLPNEVKSTYSPAEELSKLNLPVNHHTFFSHPVKFYSNSYYTLITNIATVY